MFYQSYYSNYPYGHQSQSYPYNGACRASPYPSGYYGACSRISSPYPMSPYANQNQNDYYAYYYANYYNSLSHQSRVSPMSQQVPLDFSYNFNSSNPFISSELKNTDEAISASMPHKKSSKDKDRKKKRSSLGPDKQNGAQNQFACADSCTIAPKKDNIEISTTQDVRTLYRKFYLLELIKWYVV